MSQSFLAELKRRNVYRVGVGYAAAMFVLLQAAELVLTAMGGQEQLFRLLVVLALVGFPVALVLAWLYDVTPDGITRTAESQEPRSGVSGWQMVWAAALVVSALLVGGTGWWFLRTSEQAALDEAASLVADSKSLVVMPFANLSGDDQEEYFSDGMTDAVITGLARVRGLLVTSRTSSFALKDSPLSHGEIADLLKVSSILEGSVRKNGETVRVDVQLADATNGFEIWTERYERPLSDVFAVQDEIARAIVRVLEVTLAERPDRDLVFAPTSDAMAYDKFLWGDYNRNKRTPEGLRDAIGNYEDALSRDPEYAEAHAGLAHTYLALAGLPRSSRDNAMARAEESISAALELDPDLASAHAAKGMLLFRYNYDWDGAEVELRRAIDLEPQSAEAHQLLARVLAVRGRTEEALTQARRAVQLDRLAPGALVDNAIVLHSAGDANGALQQYEAALSIDPTFEDARRGKGFVLLTLGRNEEASALLARPGGREGPEGSPPDGSPERDGPPSLDDVVSSFRARVADGEGVGAVANFLAPVLALNGRTDEAIELLNAAHQSRTLEPLDLARALAIPTFRESEEAAAFLRRIGIRVGDS